MLVCWTGSCPKCLGNRCRNRRILLGYNIGNELCQCTNAWPVSMQGAFSSAPSGYKKPSGTAVPYVTAKARRRDHRFLRLRLHSANIHNSYAISIGCARPIRSSIEVLAVLQLHDDRVETFPSIVIFHLQNTAL